MERNSFASKLFFKNDVHGVEHLFWSPWTYFFVANNKTMYEKTKMKFFVCSRCIPGFLFFVAVVAVYTCVWTLPSPLTGEQKISKPNEELQQYIQYVICSSFLATFFCKA